MNDMMMVVCFFNTLSSIYTPDEDAEEREILREKVIGLIEEVEQLPYSRRTSSLLGKCSEIAKYPYSMSTNDLDSARIQIKNEIEYSEVMRTSEQLYFSGVKKVGANEYIRILKNKKGVKTVVRI